MTYNPKSSLANRLKANAVACAALIAVLATAGPTFAQQAQDTSRYQGMEKDEAGLWYVMDKVEEEYKTSGKRITDPALNAYAQEVTCKVIGHACKDIRPYLIEEPIFNAFMAPNGFMAINTGLMLRAQNEAQFACVIGHEYGHFKAEHSLSQWRSAKDMANGLMVLSLAAGAAVAAGGISGDGANALLQSAGYFAVGSLSSFSRDHEREADKIGFEVTAATGYSSAECAQTWRALMDEYESSGFKKVRKAGSKKSAGVFSSHPVPIERAETLTEMANASPGGVDTGEDRYYAATERFLGDWMETELLAKDFDRHIFLFQRLKEQGRNPGIVEYYLGEAYRLRRGEGDREKAVQHWENAVKHAGAPAEAWRALGEHFRRQKRKDDAVLAYTKYLEASPQAGDAALIRNYVKRLNGGK